jgi:DNA polymerase III epsilon subunit-like protein
MNYIFYDLETNGLDYYTTGIMQISILNIKGEVLLNQYTYPYDNRIDCSDIHGIDEKKLVDNNAITTVELCENIKQVLRKHYGREDIYFIAYNNFGYDQIILENNFKICGIKMPYNWFFIDLFPIIKELYPNFKPNHKLKTVYENMFKKDDSITFHSSLDDTRCIYNIFMNIKDIYNILPKYTRPLLHSIDINRAPISSLYGYHDSMQLQKKNINTIGDMYKIFQNNINFEEYIRDKYGLYSKFYINNMIKQLNIIKHLQR